MSTIQKLTEELIKERSKAQDEEIANDAWNKIETKHTVTKAIEEEVGSAALAENLHDPQDHPSIYANQAQGQLGGLDPDTIEEVVVTGKYAERDKDDPYWKEYEKRNTDPDNIQFEDLEEIHTKRRFKIDTFRYNFDQGARGNRFSVDFYCPPLGFSLEGLRCVSASLPGRQLETADFSEYGPTRKLPYNLGMDGQEVTFTFVCDSSFADRYLIEAWQSAIFQGKSELVNNAVTFRENWVDEYGDEQNHTETIDD